MHSADIQAELKKRGITQKSIADELEVTEFHISEVINKKRVSDRVMRAISEKIGRDHRELFSEYYFGKKRRHPATHTADKKAA